MKPKKIKFERRIIEILEYDEILPTQTERELLKRIRRNNNTETWESIENQESKLKENLKNSLLDFYRLQSMIDEGKGHQLMKEMNF